MRAAQLVSYEKDFQVNSVAEPTITAPHDVIVRVGAAGFCRTDIHMWLGQFDAMQKGAGVDLPFTCGHETAGWVAEVVTGVTYVSVGDGTGPGTRWQPRTDSRRSSAFDDVVIVG